MADTFMSLADLVKINNANLAERDITDLLQGAPLLAALAADTTPYTTHSYLKETGAVVVGFRAPNAGLDNKASADTQVDVLLKILDASFAADKALAYGYRKGPDAYIARELRRHIRAAYFQAETQFIQGTVGGAAAGFTGFADALPTLATAMVSNASGTTAATGSSVYALRTTDDFNNVTVIAGKDGVVDVGETTIIAKDDGTGKTFPALYTPVLSWLGLQIGGKYSLGRLCNITADSGKTLTDTLIANFLSLFPSSSMPTHLAMGRRSLYQLRASRTATNATGAPAPIPTEAFGIPIVQTEAIGAAETLIA